MTFVPFVKVRRAKHVDDFETWADNRPAPTLNAIDNTGDTHATVLIPIEFGWQENQLAGQHRADGTTDPLTCTKTLAVAYDTAVRRLTPLECERLMGWPDHWTAEGINGPISDSHRYRMCGNGVVTPVAEWIGNRL